MNIIDVHTHAWPDSVAQRALAGTVRDLHSFGDGRVSSLVAALDEARIGRAVCLAIGNTPERVENANRFIGSLDRTRFIGFGSVHAGLSPEQNIEGLERHDLVGAKIHPLFQNYGLDDPGLLATLDAMQGRFMALIHVGAGNEHAKELCTPTMLRRVLDLFPRLDVIACHFGGYRMLDEAEATVIGTRAYVDTAWPPTLRGVDAARLRAIIRRHGVERVLFGSDWPMASPGAEVESVRALGLTAAETEAILGRNFEQLLARYERKTGASA
jgi:predicted TIM-barrel fold metal-dependent hydrolase